MATYTISASELKCASGSTWTSGKARQGVYSNTRYEGAINFSGLSSFDMSNINITQIQMSVVFGAAGAESTKYLTFYQSAKSTIGGSIASMRGASIGSIAVSNAYDRTVKLTFDTSTNASLFNSFKSYFMAGNRILILYVPTTRGTYSGGYCYDYLGVTACSLTFTFDYLQSDGTLASTTVAAGSAATMNITAYNSAYSHRITWQFGSYSNVQSVAPGVATASYLIPLSWLNAIPSATSGAASATLETLDTGGNVLGTSSYGFTITAPESVVPTISSVAAVPVNSNSVINSWGIYVYGKTQARLTINGASGSYGSTIKSYSITTNPSVGSNSASTMTTGVLYTSGTVTVTAKVTDSRGRTATKTTTFSVYAYSAPTFSAVEAYRCNSNGTRNEASGTYARLKVDFACTTLGNRNNVSCRVVLSQVGGSYSTSSNMTSGTAVTLGGGNLAIDAVYRAVFTLTDTVETVSTYTVDIGSVAYIMHVKKGGKAIGFGMAAGADSTVSFGWPIKLNTPLEVSQGGTGANTAANACANIGAVKKSGDTMTGDLHINGTNYPSVKLFPSNNDTTFRSVLEGSYTGAISISAWNENSGNNRRMLEVRNSAYAPSLDNAITLRNAVNGTYSNYRVFHSGMATPVPVASGGTGAANAKAALSSLGIFYTATLPTSGTDGQICLVPV